VDQVEHVLPKAIMLAEESVTFAASDISFTPSEEGVTAAFEAAKATHADLVAGSPRIKEMVEQLRHTGEALPASERWERLFTLFTSNPILFQEVFRPAFSGVRGKALSEYAVPNLREEWEEVDTLFHRLDRLIPTSLFTEHARITLRPQTDRVGTLYLEVCFLAGWLIGVWRASQRSHFEKFSEIKYYGAELEYVVNHVQAALQSPLDDADRTIVSNTVARAIYTRVNPTKSESAAVTLYKEGSTLSVEALVTEAQATDARIAAEQHAVRVAAAAAAADAEQLRLAALAAAEQRRLAALAGEEARAVAAAAAAAAAAAVEAARRAEYNSPSARAARKKAREDAAAMMPEPETISTGGLFGSNDDM
jgi:hypothetical protein